MQTLKGFIRTRVMVTYGSKWRRKLTKDSSIPAARWRAWMRGVIPGKQYRDELCAFLGISTEKLDQLIRETRAQRES